MEESGGIIRLLYSDTKIFVKLYFKFEKKFHMPMQAKSTTFVFYVTLPIVNKSIYLYANTAFNGKSIF